MCWCQPFPCPQCPPRNTQSPGDGGGPQGEELAPLGQRFSYVRPAACRCTGLEEGMLQPRAALCRRAGPLWGCPLPVPFSP